MCYRINKSLEAWKLWWLEKKQKFKDRFRKLTDFRAWKDSAKNKVAGWTDSATNKMAGWKDSAGKLGNVKDWWGKRDPATQNPGEQREAGTDVGNQSLERLKAWWEKKDSTTQGPGEESEVATKTDVGLADLPKSWREGWCGEKTSTTRKPSEGQEAQLPKNQQVKDFATKKTSRESVEAEKNGPET